MVITVPISKPTAATMPRGLILLSCGVRGNVIRILAPLTIDMEHLDEGLAILESSFDACVQEALAS